MDATVVENGRLRLVKHPFLEELKHGRASREIVSRLLKEYWTPLHYFPTFLAGVILTLEDKVEAQSGVARILAQELGDGNYDEAHETLYLEMTNAFGLTSGEVCNNSPSEQTRALLAQYMEGSREVGSAIGCLEATESTDLSIVSSMGKAVRDLTRQRAYSWIDVHVTQEPDHVASAGHVRALADPATLAGISRSAESMWRAWDDFFNQFLG